MRSDEETFMISGAFLIGVCVGVLGANYIISKHIDDLNQCIYNYQELEKEYFREICKAKNDLYHEVKNRSDIAETICSKLGNLSGKFIDGAKSALNL